MQINFDYTFKYNWELVVKGFFVKYPHKEFDFIKFNQVIDFKINPDQTMFIKRLVYSKKFLMWSLTMEEIVLNSQNKIMDMKTHLVKGRFFPGLMADEQLSFRSINENTLYKKQLFNVSSELASMFRGKIEQSFLKGCKLVEDKCMELLKQ